MQIQRIQSLYIFLAFVCMALFTILPYGMVEATGPDSVTYAPMYVWAEYGVLIPVAAVAVLLLVGLFMYRTPATQRTVLVVCFMLTLSIAATICFALFKQGRGAEGVDASFSVWDLLVAAAAVFEILGIKGIMHDIKLLNSYNRLR